MPEKGERGIGKSELHQRNVLWLVKALLLLAKGDLKLENSQLSVAVKVEWVTESTLRVTGEYREKTRTGKEKLEEGTTQQALWQLGEKTDTPLKLPKRRREVSFCTEEKRQDDAVRNALRYLDDLGVLKDERPKNKRNTRYWIFTLMLKHKDASLEENLRVVEQKLGLETSASTEEAGALPLSFWQDCCRKKLPCDLSINPLLHGDGLRLTLDDIVPLELVERKQQPQQKKDFSPEHFQVQAPTEYETPVEHDKFLAQVLETGDSLKNRDRKIAVIGEPGAGKTTLLQEIAKEVEGAGGLPIFVRLADLGEKTLKDYLLEDWLEEATRKRRISDDIQDDFVQQFNLGRVWLLLDGVDEIAATGNLLSSLEKQLKGWVADARIVLTCRLNVWDVGKNDLYAFEKYRIQQLSYPDLVGDFIRRFFSKAGEPTKGETLIEKLERSQPRIRDLVKNPLRLTLLCRTWKRRREQEELPRTKAELYKQFVETFYEWKDKPEIDQEKRQLLEQALGELAKNAIDKETIKFRLRESFVRQELDKFDKSLFDLACRVSWINNVGVAAENQDEAVYAFFHPTFQEYFAALAIRDWKDFLNHVPHNPAQGIYRIFEPQWKEVILLWLGREDVLPAHKQEFLMALVNFDSKCCNLYRYRAIFLATAGLTESREFLEFDDFCLEDNSEQGNEEGDNESIRRGAASALGKIYSDFPEVVTTAVNILINLIRTSADESIYQNAARSIRQILQNHQSESALSALKSCRQNSVVQEDAVRYEAFYSVLFYCAYNLPYPTFYQAWHPQERVGNTTTPDRQTLNQADLPQSLQSAIANDSQLSQIIHLICIDGSQFIEPDRPAAEIYDQMLDQNCPECNPAPKTMAALKLYWNSFKRNSDKRPVLVFYASSTEPYSGAFFTDLSKFKGAICVVTSPPTPLLQGEGSKSSSGSPSSLQGEGVREWGSLQFFTPSQPIADVTRWIRAIAFS